MEELREALEQYLNEHLQQIIISNPKIKGGVNKIHIRPVLLQNKLMFQFAAYTEKQVFHENLSKNEAMNRIISDMEQFKQLEMAHASAKINVLVSKKGKVTFKKKGTKVSCEPSKDLSHNRKKQYLLEPGVMVPFLQDLGVQTTDGKIVHSKYDKFKQINRFLEFIEDVEKYLPKDREAVIIDFGCGKSYLTFAMYYYLHELKKHDVRMIGLDLKEDVIKHCNELRDHYGYEKLDFFIGDIADYEGVSEVDMVVTLHACDTATDFALAKAVNWGAKIILSVPCCQHEYNKQMDCEMLSPLFRYGLIKERSAALFTDAVRAEILKDWGYQVQVLEFIDMEHTPKNILIRAVKNKSTEITSEGLGSKQPSEEICSVLQFLNVEPTLYRLLYGNKK